MNHSALVRVMDCRADALEQTKPLGHVQLALVAPGVNRLTVDVLHHKVRPSFLSAAAVVESSDVGVLQRSQNLALPKKTLDHFGPGRFRGHDFDRDLLCKKLVRASS